MAKYVVGTDQQGRWYWQCDLCWWRGLDCGTENYANQEAQAHLIRDHEQASAGQR